MKVIVLGLLLFSFNVVLLGQKKNDPSKTKKTTAGKRQHPSRHKKELNVVISVTKTSSYCGGARPTKEMEERSKMPLFFEAKKLFIKKGEKNSFGLPIVTEAIADTAGKICIKLPPGKYLIVDEEKKDSAYYNSLLKKYSEKTEFYSAINVECLKGWFEKPDFVFEVKPGSKNEFSINYYISCPWHRIPCAQYNGPLPP